jgi:hypothetical protein
MVRRKKGDAMPEATEEKDQPFQQAPVIISEIRLNYNEVFTMNRRIIDAVLDTETDVVSKIGLLSRILPGLVAAGSCTCSCSCNCSCSCTCGGEVLSEAVATPAGRAK